MTVNRILLKIKEICFVNFQDKQNILKFSCVSYTKRNQTKIFLRRAISLTEHNNKTKSTNILYKINIQQ
jgi:hypothetical protein